MSVISTGSAEEERARGAPTSLDSSASAFSRSEAWQQMAGARDMRSLACAWLTLQCLLIDRVEAGVVFLCSGEQQKLQPIAAWPPIDVDLGYLTEVGQTALTSRKIHSTRPKVAALLPHESRVQIACPIESGGMMFGVAALDLAPRSETEITQANQILYWGIGRMTEAMLGSELRALRSRAERTERALDAIEVTLGQEGFISAGMGLVNQLARQFRCERVSLGMVKGGIVKVEALSNAALFEERSQLLSLIREAMEECVAFKRSILHPSSEGETFPAHNALSQDAGQQSVLSVPLCSAHLPVGAIVLERKPGEAFQAEEQDVLSALGDIVGPLLDVKRDAQRSLWKHLRENAAQFVRKFLGPRHATIKFVTVSVLIAALVMIFGVGDYRVTARTVVEGSVQLAAAAPFDGYIAASYVRAGDQVKAEQVLCELDDMDLNLERERWVNEKGQLERKHREALANMDRSNVRVLSAQISQADAQLALAEHRLSRTRILAPFDGVIVSGDLSQMIGSPVETGKVLFQVATLSQYRVILKVDDRDIADVKLGQRGELVLAGLAREKLPFTIKNITSVSSQEDGRNFFRTEAQVDVDSAALRPGMEGVGKISAGEQSLLWIWTHGFTDWLRLWLWGWWP